MLKRAFCFFRSVFLFTFLFLVLNYEKLNVNATVLAIDYGHEWIKAALVKHGVPIEIVLTKDSKRKDLSTIGFNGEERLYGARAFDFALKSPSTVFPSLKLLIGKSYTSDEVKQYLTMYQSVNLTSTADQLNILLVQNNKTFSVEELIAMVFENYKMMAEDIAGEKIKDVVLTVPSYFTEIERHALLDSAEVAGLNVISLVNDGLAIAINYATTRLFDEKPQYHIFYDMGAGSTTATFVSFRTKVHSNNKTTTAVEVMGVGYDRNFGGDTITWKLVDYLLDELGNMKGPKIRKLVKHDSKAIIKLFREASRVKQILSANSEAHVMIENLYENIDYNVKVTRGTFEKLMEEFSERIKKPITTAVAMTPIAIRFLSSVILAGGSVRIPFIQKQIETVVGSEKVSKSVNADEAAVMGAVFRGAGLSGQFRVKNIKSVDITLNSIFISYLENLSDVSSLITHSLFMKGAKLDVEKTLTFFHSDDFDIEFSEVPGRHLPGVKFASLKLSGFNESVDFLKNEYGCDDFVTTVTFKLDASGFITMYNPLLKCRAKHYIKSFFELFNKRYSGRNKDDIFDKNESSEDLDYDDDEPKFRTLNFEISYTNINPRDKAFKLASRNMLRDLNEMDKKKVARDEARNILETYIYNVQEFLENDDFIAVSTEEQREKLSNLVQNVKEWLVKNGDISTLSEFVEHKKSIEVLEEPISERKKDVYERSTRILELRRRIEGLRHYLKNLPIERVEILDESDNNTNISFEDIKKNNFGSGQGPRYKVLEAGFKPQTVEDYSVNIDKIENWLDESIKAQEALKPWEPSILRVKDIVSKIWELEDLKEHLRVMEHVFLKSRNMKKQEPINVKSSAI
ncbi:hypothetical protein PORY_002309 [Pneumocystis oryctolagi]|uniref:Uncharacterized protein n=1 Tax=Pneumocystis oryctolagi TaxID=42067 RepID=A0ACB7CBY0_9ASCO|nr:hypothetical protein PORY_002309 [Pneumocystis oryctolagi]